MSQDRLNRKLFWNSPRGKSALCWLCICVFATGSLNAQSNDEAQIVSNGSFEKWTGDAPDGWSVAKGAGAGNSPASKVKKASDGSLQLSGNKSTVTWNYVSQKINVERGGTYQLNVTAKANGIKSEKGQNNNCYVGVFSMDGLGKVVSQSQTTIDSEDYSDSSIVFDVPKDAAKTEIWIFLSKTGKLSVKLISAKVIKAEDSFDILVADMDRNYSYFEHKKVDWKALTDKYRNRANKAKDPAKFAKVVNEMLVRLKDMHVWVIQNGEQLKGFQVKWDKNYDFDSIIPGLKDRAVVRGVCLTGKTKDGFGYVLIESMSGFNDQVFNEVATNIKNLFDTPGIIVDLRTNKGGNEKVGQLIAGMFCEKKHLYAKQKVRSGPGHSDFSETYERHIEPWRVDKAGKAYTKPVICLQGPGAVSSAEGFTLMMKAIPQCTNVGLPTRGASGNPNPIKLPNGVEVWYSRWIAMDPDGNPFEDVGVQPDVEVKPKKKGDATFDKAVELLREATKK